MMYQIIQTSVFMFFLGIICGSFGMAFYCIKLYRYNKKTVYGFKNIMDDNVFMVDNKILELNQAEQHATHEFYRN